MKHLLKPSSRLAVALLTLPFALFLCAAAMNVDEARTAPEETVYGTVRDSNSHPIPGVHIEIYSDGDKTPVLFGDTNEKVNITSRVESKHPSTSGTATLDSKHPWLPAWPKKVAPMSAKSFTNQVKSDPLPRSMHRSWPGTGLCIWLSR